MKKKTGLIGLYSGNEIIRSAKKPKEMITRTQTAKQAHQAIIKKYGEISPNSKYHHVGNGNWIKYSLANDKKRTGKMTDDIKVWRQKPHKLDYRGIDTKEHLTKVEKKKFKVELIKTKKILSPRTVKPKTESTPVIKHSGYFGENLTKGKYKPYVNLKRSVINILKKHYPLTGFIVSLSEHNSGAFGTVHIYWAGKPTLTEIKLLNLNMGGQGRRNFRVTKQDISYHNISESDMASRITQMVGNNDSKRFYQASYIGPKLKTKPKISSKFAELSQSKQLTGRKTKTGIVKKINATTKREPGTFKQYGKKITEGKYKDDFANIRANITSTLKEKYPDQLFMIVARGFYNREADVYWTGGPTETEVRKIGLGISPAWLSRDDIDREVYWHRISSDKLRAMINKVEHNKSLKTRAKVSYTRKLKASDLEAPKKEIKMPAKIPTKTPAAVPKKTIKGRGKKAGIQIVHSPVLKSGTPKAKVYKGFLVTGNTYAFKNQIKALGGKWNADRKGWVVPPGSAKAINALKKEKKLTVTSIKTEEDVFRRLTEAERLDIRKAKSERKAERYDKSASKKFAESDRLYKRSHDLVKDIPLGQPILVGHHSEKAHRKVLDKSWNAMGKSIHMQDEANEAARKADVLSHVTDRLGTASDLQGRITKMEKEYNHARNKVTKAEENKQWAIRRGDTSESDRYDAEAKYWAKKAENIKIDIKSMEDRLPSGAKEKPTYGITMNMLGGTKLKPLVGATSVARRYHNKNLKGGNFAIEVRKGNRGIELHGYHDINGIIYNLSIGPLFSIGAQVITQENYKEYTIDKLALIIKKALE